LRNSTGALMRTFLFAGAAFLLTAVPAWSADSIVAAPVASFNWSGAYLGAEIGYGWGKSHHFTQTTPASTPKFTLDGALGGVTAGYNYQINNWVLGAEADFSAADIKGSVGSTPEWGCDSGCRTKVDWFGTVRARAGYAFDRTLPYVTGGLAYGHIKGYVDGEPDYSRDNTNAGWTVGAGVEHAFTDHLTAKIEYLYVDLGKIDIEDFGVPFGQGYADAKFSTIKVGLNYKF